MFWIKVLLLLIGATVSLSQDEEKRNPFKKIAPGIYDDWAKISPDLVSDDNEYFGLVHAGGRIFVVSDRGLTVNDTSLPRYSALRGGIVSIWKLTSETWSHVAYDRLTEDQYRDSLLTLGDQLFMLASSTLADKIEFHKLFYYNDVQGKWIEVPIEIDPNSFQPLTRGERMFLSISVPDQAGNVAYLSATDHEMNETDSETTLSKLEVNFVDGLPISASLKPITAERILSPLSQAIISTAAKDDKLFVFICHFLPNSDLSTVSIDFAIDLKTGQKIDGPFSNMSAVIDYYSSNRVIQIKDVVLILGPNEVLNDDFRLRRMWLLDLNQMTYQVSDALFPNVPRRVFAVDMDYMIYTAGLRQGLYGARVRRSSEAETNQSSKISIFDP